jgi:hypothetical protein
MWRGDSPRAPSPRRRVPRLPYGFHTGSPSAGRNCRSPGRVAPLPSTSGMSLTCVGPRPSLGQTSRAGDVPRPLVRTPASRAYAHATSKIDLFACRAPPAPAARLADPRSGARRPTGATRRRGPRENYTWKSGRIGRNESPCSLSLSRPLSLAPSHITSLCHAIIQLLIKVKGRASRSPFHNNVRIYFCRKARQRWAIRKVKVSSEPELEISFRWSEEIN